MLKKLALPVVALVMLMILASAPAKAAVRFGITVGPPVYTYPAYPYYPGPSYTDPYAYPYVAPDYYYSPAPAYVYPGPSFSFGWGGGHREHESREHRGNQFRGNDRGGRGFSNESRGGHRR